VKVLLLVLRSILRGLALAVGTDDAASDRAPSRVARRISALERGAAIRYDRLERVARELARG
jgi:hypothetical protein